MTSWALLALCRGGYAAHPAIARAVRFLVDRQQHDGGYAEESYAGMFSRTTMINYDNYRRYFLIWALATWLQTVALAERLAPTDPLAHEGEPRW